MAEKYQMDLANLVVIIPLTVLWTTEPWSPTDLCVQERQREKTNVFRESLETSLFLIREFYGFLVRSSWRQARDTDDWHVTSLKLTRIILGSC